MDQRLDEAIARVAGPLDYQGARLGLDPTEVRKAIALWESLRAEAIVDEAGEEEVQITVLDEEAQVAIYDRCVRIGAALTAWVAGWITQFAHAIPEDRLAEGLEDFRLHARAKIGTEIGLALVKGLRIAIRDTDDRIAGMARLESRYFNLSLYEGSVIAEDEFTPEEERLRRSRWILRYVLATQHDRDRHASTLLLDLDEQAYVDKMVESVNADVVPDQDDMVLLDYLMSKLQPNNAYFGTTQGIEQLWLGQVADILQFLRAFPEMDHRVLDEIEIRMVEGVREQVNHLLKDPTLGGTLHDVVEGKCRICNLDQEEAGYRPICSDRAREQLEQLLPLGALPDLYLTKARILRAGEA